MRFYLAPPTGSMFNWGEFNGAQGMIEIAAHILLQDGCTPGRVRGRAVCLGKLNEQQLAIVPPRQDRLRARRVRNDGLAAYRREKGLNPDGSPCFVYGKRAASGCLVWALVPLKPGAPETDFRYCHARAVDRT